MKSKKYESDLKLVNFSGHDKSTLNELQVYLNWKYKNRKTQRHRIATETWKKVERLTDYLQTDNFLIKNNFFDIHLLRLYRKKLGKKCCDRGAVRGRNMSDF